MGLFEAGLGLYARKSVLKKASIRIPTGPSDAWTAAEFTSALKKLKADGFTKPLDAKMNYGQSEWYTYGFAPIIWSAGGDLINRKTYKTASGVLNSPADIAAMTVFKSWFDDDLVDPNKDDAAFLNGRSAISWVGHWQYTSYKAKFGSDLVILPLPNFGHGSKSASGSWNWGITSGVKDPDAAWSFLAFLLKTKQQVQTATGNGGVPSTASAYNKMSTFKAGGDERIYVTQLKSGVAMARPQTPAYPVITVAFRQAVADISAGGDVKTALDAAVKTINQDLRDNYYYPKLKK
jgi:multiple sugar transport system substrate-binding protein